MDKIFQLDSAESIKETIVQTKKMALSALHNYDLDWTQIRFHQLSDTATFIIETNVDGTFLLRIHSGMKKEAIDSELVWLESLYDKLKIVPLGIVDRNGSRTVTIDRGDGYFAHASLMRWVEGTHINSGLTDDQIYKEGILLANLHSAVQDFELPFNFIRPVWGEQSFIQATTRLAEHYIRFLTDAEYKLYRLAIEKVLCWFNTIHKNEHNYGLIHGDLHQGNIVFHNGNPRPIDFGRCGFGYFLYDVAHTILGLHPLQRELVIKGYLSIRELDKDWLPDLESFSVMVMIENYCHHAPDPRETEGLREEQPYAQAILRNYLNGTPFLFNRIEV
ncbi:phosphotransferase enzyme family protein [Paenibacillus motobuensis]|uniref:Phosphotransferase enzyme family protein n=1 Tax=Paenibacillus motobuensis TaxID=295324 RepID=A0ABP3I1Q4_9BACL